METIKVKIKWFNNKKEAKEAKEYAKKVGLKEFNVLAFQANDGRPKEGIHEIELKHMFDNQYNTKGGLRIFEYRDILENTNYREINQGYYISEGIEKIRAYQKTITRCNYCGKQYINSTQEYCTACRGSEHLEEDNYKLLRITSLLDKQISDKPLPKDVIKDIEKQQKSARLERIETDKIRFIDKQKKDLAESKVKFAGFEEIVKRGLDYKNCIYYGGESGFCFGWRDSIKENERKVIENKMQGFPYQWSIK